MQQRNFESILDIPSSDVERPKPIPTGTYTWMIKGLPRFDKSSKKQTDFAEFTVTPLSAMDDVDQDTLEEMPNWRDRTQRLTYYITPDALWRLKAFLEHCGIEAEEGKTIRQMIDEAPGRQFLGHVKHRPSDDGQVIYAEIDKTAPVE